MANVVIVILCIGVFTWLTFFIRCHSCGYTVLNNSRIIFDKIDNNGDEKVTEEELENWIELVKSRYLRAHIDRQWSEHNPDNSPTLRWASYKHRVYAFTEGLVTDLFIITISYYITQYVNQADFQ